MLTREDILAMNANDELSALIAEKVFGLKLTTVNGVRLIEDENRYYEIEPYATDISAAWEVVEKMSGEYAFEVGRPGERFGRRWTARFGMLNDWAGADTAPLAICKAALISLISEETL